MSLAGVATAFHSLEYMTIVSWYVKQNQSLSETKPFSLPTPRWLVSITVFMACYSIQGAHVQGAFSPVVDCEQLGRLLHALRI